MKFHFILQNKMKKPEKANCPVLQVIMCRTSFYACTWKRNLTPFKRRYINRILSGTH